MYSRILVAFDGSAVALRALDEAAKLAQLCGARLLVLHVVEGVSGGYVPTDVYFSDVLPRFVRQGEKLLEDAAQSLRSKGIEVETLLLQGDSERVSELIVGQARARGADLLVLGTHGRRGFSRLMMGSDAEQVVRLSPVPVLLVGPAPTP